MTQLTTPYNFVPLSDKVYFPEWANEDELSHDAPLKNGWCGTLRIRITASTPLLVAGAQTGAERHPVKVMDQYAIPGSSLRGMLRNVLEIATFGKFGRAVNDRAMSIRDLTPSGEEYRRRINADTVHAGWLRLASEHGNQIASIEPTEMLRMDVDEAKAWADETKNEGKDPYEMYTEETDLDTREITDWVVVRTGSVSRKREDFLFRHLPSGAAKPISRDLFQQFASAHQHNPLWVNKQGQPGDLQKRLMEGRRIPVFFICDPDDKTRIQAFGLAYMFRVPYRHSLHDAIRFSAPAHHEASRLDFCEALLGLIHDGEDNHPQSRRSRVGFGLALATQAKPHPDRRGIDVVLNEPKPSFYPAYIKGGQTLMSARPQLAGWKRYPVRSQAAPQDTGVGNQNVGSKLFPLQTGATFEGDITLHNIHPEELGGLLWALTWGQQPQLRHSLGMGRPFGFGSLSIEVIQLDLRHNSDASQDKNLISPKDEPALAEVVQQLMQPFTAAMETFVSNWATSEPMKELLAMANPALGDKAAEQLRYMPLKDHRLVKGGQGNPAQTLKRFTIISQHKS